MKVFGRIEIQQRRHIAYEFLVVIRTGCYFLDQKRGDWIEQVCVAGAAVVNNVLLFPHFPMQRRAGDRLPALQGRKLTLTGWSGRVLNFPPRSTRQLKE